MFLASTAPPSTSNVPAVRVSVTSTSAPVFTVKVVPSAATVFAETVPATSESAPKVRVLALIAPPVWVSFLVTSSALPASPTVPAVWVSVPTTFFASSFEASPATLTSPVIVSVTVIVPPSCSTVAVMFLASTVPPSTSNVPAVRVSPTLTSAPVFTFTVVVPAAISVAETVPETSESAPKVRVLAVTSLSFIVLASTSVIFAPSAAISLKLFAPLLRVISNFSVSLFATSFVVPSTSAAPL